MKSKCHKTFWRFFLDKRNLGSFGRRQEASRRLHKALGCAMSQENTKLGDFSNTNNNDFISTPIAPPVTSVEAYEIKVALLNIVERSWMLPRGG